MGTFCRFIPCNLSRLRLSLRSFSRIYFIRTSAHRQMKRSKHREDPKDVESEAHGREKESLSENAEAAEDSQWVKPLEEVCIDFCDAKLCCFVSPI